MVYAVPGVPYEMSDMFERAIAPDLRRRMAEAGETTGVIASRVIRTWGMSESGLAETLADYIERLDVTPQESPVPTDRADVPAPATVAFLASGIEGIKVRVTVRADDDATAIGRLDAEEAVIRAILHEAAGDVVFGVDDEAIEDAVARVLVAEGLTLGLAESLTGGLAASRLVNVPGASRWFRGSVVSYASEVKFSVLGVPEGPVVSETAARAMADGARRVLGADVGLADDRRGRARSPGRPTARHGVRGRGPSGSRDLLARVQGAGRPGPGPSVRHHRRPGPAPPDHRDLRPCPEAGIGGASASATWSWPRVAALVVEVTAAGVAAGVTGMPTGTSSTQLSPGCRVRGAPSAVVSVAGWVSEARLHVPAMATPFRMTTTGPVPVAVTSTSWPPSLFSTQGPVAVCTVMMTTFVVAVWDPSRSLSGVPE